MTSAPAEGPAPTVASSDADGGPAHPATRPEHGCVRCGARIPLSESMCERCNPLGLKAPAASQAHGTVFLGIIAAVVIMAVVAFLAVRGVGPFPAAIADVQPDPAGLRVTISISNDGAAAGRTTCRIGDPEIRGIGPETAYVQSPMVEGGATVEFEAVVVSLGTTPRPLTVDCGS
jgi:predicted nucleic acid-binding Zn ribbon protein